MRKILFLDLDGVLNPRLWGRKPSADKYGCAFDSKCVANLERIIAETCADIVISSSWKCMGLAELQNMWKDRKLPGNVVDITPDYMSDEILLNTDLRDIDPLYNRGCEIKGWLMRHKDEEIHYVILDDMDDVLPEQQPHFVWVDPNVGITEGNVIQAIMILNHLENEIVREELPPVLPQTLGQ